MQSFKALTIAFSATFFVLTAAAATRAVVPFLPHVSLVKEAGCKDVEVSVLLKAGANPHSFDPSVRDIKMLAACDVYLAAGFPFETRLLERVRELKPSLKIVSLTNGCDLIANDPHLWISVSNRAVMVRNIRSALGGDENTGIWSPTVRAGAAFVSCHPTWNYLCRDLGLNVINLERNGREPTVKSLAEDLQAAKRAGVKLVVTEPQFPRRTAERFAKELGAEILTLDPLAADTRGEIEKLLNALSR